MIGEIPYALIISGITLAGLIVIFGGLSVILFIAI
jgi:hypothetical protein